MLNYVKILVGALLLFGSQMCYAAYPIDVDEHFQELELVNNIEYATSNDSMFDEFKLQTFSFKPYDFDSIRKQPGSYWLKIDIDNHATTEQYFAIGTSRFDYLTLYYQDFYGEVFSSKSGQKFPNNQKQINFGSNSYAGFFTPANSINTVYIFVKNDQAYNHQLNPLPITLYSKSRIDGLSKNSNWFITFFLGAVVIMTIYNIALYFIVRKEFYLWYILNNITVVLLVLVLSGLLENIYFNNFKFHEPLLLIMANLSLTTYMLFSKSILNFKKYDPPWDKRVNMGLIAWTALLSLAALNLNLAAVIVGIFGTVVGYNIVVVSTIKAIRNGSEPAKYFLVGNVFFYIGVTCSTLQIFNVLPNSFIGLSSVEFLEIGTLIQLSLFSLTLGSTINSMRDKIIRKELEKNMLRREEERKFSRLIQQKNAELEVKVVQRTHELREFAKIIEQKNHDIMDSLNYAKRIQTAILPDQEMWTTILDKSFVLYQPKEIISGDFYWLNVSKTDDTLYFAACDCTGHGVPGAMVSVVGYNNLNRCVNEFGLNKPSDILNQLNKLVEEAFEGGESQDNINDGMDIALCALKYYPIARKGQPIAKLQYAGANNPLWLIRNENTTPRFENTHHKVTRKNGFALIEVKPDKQPIGKFHARKPFNNQEFELYEDDQLYIFSDGYVDQFGGPMGKKFKSRQFRELLLSIYEMEPNDQKSHLHNSFENWRGHEEQVDDICVVGIKV